MKISNRFWTLCVVCCLNFTGIFCRFSVCFSDGTKKELPNGFKPYLCALTGESNTKFYSEIPWMEFHQILNNVGFYLTESGPEIAKNTTFSPIAKLIWLEFNREKNRPKKQEPILDRNYSFSLFQELKQSFLPLFSGNSLKDIMPINADSEDKFFEGKINGVTKTIKLYNPKAKTSNNPIRLLFEGEGNNFFSVDLSEFQMQARLSFLDAIVPFEGLLIKENAMPYGAVLGVCYWNVLETLLEDFNGDEIYDYHMVCELFSLAEALENMHIKGILHRDIHMGNIYVDFDSKSHRPFRLLIGNFSKACLKNRENSCRQVKEKDKRDYHPPELVENLIFFDFACKDSVDWFEFGLLLNSISLKALLKGETTRLFNIFAPLIQGCVKEVRIDSRYDWSVINEYFSMLEESREIEDLVVCSFYYFHESGYIPIIYDELNIRMSNFIEFSRSSQLYIAHIPCRIGQQRELEISFGNKNKKQLSIKSVQPPTIYTCKKQSFRAFCGTFNEMETKFYFPGDLIILESNFNGSFCQCGLKCMGKSLGCFHNVHPSLIKKAIEETNCFEKLSPQ